jgi:uncharacterized protein YbaR (Trm112 family)
MECKRCFSELEIDSYQNIENDVIIVFTCPECENNYPIQDKEEILKILSDEDYARYIPVDVFFNLN